VPHEVPNVFYSPRRHLYDGGTVYCMRIVGSRDTRSFLDASSAVLLAGTLGVRTASCRVCSEFFPNDREDAKESRTMIRLIIAIPISSCSSSCRSCVCSPTTGIKPRKERNAMPVLSVRCGCICHKIKGARCGIVSCCAKAGVLQDGYEEAPAETSANRPANSTPFSWDDPNVPFAQ
jgi:hypothetical protein